MRTQHLGTALGPLTAAAALILATVLTSPAHAGTSAASAPRARATAACPEGSLCFWSEPDFGGTMRTAQDPRHDCESAPFQPARSVYNHAYETRTFYSGPRCSVRVGALEPGGSARSVSVSSWR
ncbi:peptidase inhibitor family I36 protein [Streptomyces sp. NPDC058000]|uniref:peptidase inhibitor family I36 protein n=1 Tax=Streptomyces sp. NPDC058000 TaxID=3346299 RepID=UPI0036E6910B